MSTVVAGRFELLTPQQRGGMGEVWRARDTSPADGGPETVAVKLMLQRRDGADLSLSQQDHNAARFAREVRIMKRLDSEYLPKIIDGGIDDGRPYLAMEFIDGDTLRGRLKDAEGHPLPVPEAAEIARRIARGLDVIHKAGVVHRDLKPSNVMITGDGAVKVLDFGVGLILDDVGPDGVPVTRLTSRGVAVGTSEYMAPEQVTNSREAKPSADLYALGCVLYEMLTGSVPFTGDSQHEVETKHREEEPTVISEMRRADRVPETLETLVMSLLAKNPANRPATAAEVADALAAFTGTPDDDNGEDAEHRVPDREVPPAPPGDQFDIFGVHKKLISDYKDYTESFAVIRDDKVKKFVDEDIASKSQWPDPWLSLNPFFKDGGPVTDLVDRGLLDEGCAEIFQSGKPEGPNGSSAQARPIRFYQHQVDAIEAARGGDSYVLTTGTGSGKSLGYIVPVVDRVLRARKSGDTVKRVRAIIVYPMNALVNSQYYELKKFLTDGFPAGKAPVTFGKYTGQEDQDTRDRIRNEPPDILLTNYVMLELMLTRPNDRSTLIRMARGLEFLVFDELHTYRGRQGADVAMLIRRVKDACGSPDVQCVGTSATMASEGTAADRRKVVAKVAGEIFGAPVGPGSVIGETLVRATAEDAGPVTAARLNAPAAPAGYADLVRDPLASWIETTFGLDRDDEGHLARRAPVTVEQAAEDLAGQTGVPREQCEKALRLTLKAGSRAKNPETDRPLFAFRLHQFLSKGDNVYVTIEDELTREVTRDYQVEQPGSGGKILIPLAFCRECGQEYLSVWREHRKGQAVYKARRDTVIPGGDDPDPDDEDEDTPDVEDGYLYISSEAPWPRDLETALENRRVPEMWLEPHARSGEDVVKPSARKYLPQAVTVDPFGIERPSATSAGGGGIEAAFLPGRFRFCLACGVTYAQARGRDFGQLATLNAEARSSATTMTSLSIVRSLLAVKETDPRLGGLAEDARKLLTFVDNRQDAALQSGHFNDFVETAMIRGALYAAARAAADAGEEGLFYDDIPKKVTDALGLPRDEYADQPGEATPLRRRTDQALRDVVNLRVFLDMDRGWRVTMPNLEQAGLLTFGYLGLDEVCANDALWRGKAAALAGASAKTRQQVCEVVLDQMRRVLAIDAGCLDQAEFKRISDRAKNALTPEWRLEEGDNREASTVFPSAGRPDKDRSMEHFSGRTKIGQYLRRTGRFPGYAHRISIEDAEEILGD